MPDTEEPLLAVSSLHFRKGDLIMKEGDFGVSIYRILSGKVRVYAEVDGMEMALSTLGPGDMMGEMIFLSRSVQKRSASARALEDCELELLHPDLLAKEYEQMPAIVKLITGQAAKRLLRMDRMIAELSHKRHEKDSAAADRQKRVNKRAHYRKKTRMLATCQPADNSFPISNMTAEIRDISLGGVGIEVRPKILSRFPYRQGDCFRIETLLPPNKPLSFTARLEWMKPSWAPGALFLGMSMAELSEGDRKELGFFMMSN